MAITTRNYTISSTTSISNLSWSSIDMPQGMTSSVSSDGTTFLLNWDDSQVSSVSTGTLTMYANWIDEYGNERSANASIQWEILPAFSSITYEMADLQNNYQYLISNSAILISFAYSSFSFKSTNLPWEINCTLGFNNDTTSNNWYIFMHYDAEHASSVSSVMTDINETVQLASNTAANPTWANSYSDDYGSWNNNTKIWTTNYNNNYLQLTSFSYSDSYAYGPYWQGQIYFTFGIQSSSFTLRIN